MDRGCCAPLRQHPEAPGWVASCLGAWEGNKPGFILAASTPGKR